MRACAGQTFTVCPLLCARALQLILAQFLHRLSKAKTLQPIQSSRMVVYPSEKR